MKVPKIFFKKNAGQFLQLNIYDNLGLHLLFLKIIES